MAISLVSVGQKLTAAIMNAIIAAVNASGSFAVTPTSVSGTGVSLSGSKVVVAAATSVAINGCFTSTYDWYTIRIALTTSAGASLNVTLRLSGTDAVTNYDRIVQRGLGSTNTVATSLAAAAWPLNLTTLTGLTFGTIDLFDPAVAVGTRGLFSFGTSANPMTTGDGAVYNAALLHRTATAYDGFTITPTAGNVTGTIRIYGHN